MTPNCYLIQNCYYAFGILALRRESVGEVTDGSACRCLPSGRAVA